MSTTLDVLEQTYKGCKDSYLQALFTLPTTTEEKETAINKVCDLNLLPASGWRKDVFADYAKKHGYSKVGEEFWQTYWNEERYSVMNLDSILESAKEKCEGNGKLLIIEGSDANEAVFTLTYPEIVDIVFDFMVARKISGITNDW